MSLRHKAVRGVFWSAIQNWGSSLASMGIFFVLVRLLGPEAFGSVGFAAALIALLSILQRAGFSQALIQRPTLDPQHITAAFWFSATIGLVLSVGLYFGAHAVALAFDKPNLEPLLRGLSAVLLIDALGNTPQAILRRRLSFKSLAVRSLLGSTIGGAVGIGMALNGYGVYSLVGQRIVSGVVGTTTLWIESRWLPEFRFSFRHAGELFGFSVFSMGSEALDVVNRQAPSLIIGTILGDAALGYFRVGLRLVQTLTQLFTNVVHAVVLPTFSRLQHDHAQMRHAFVSAIRMSSATVFPAFLGAALIAPQIVEGLMGSNWTPSIPIMRALAIMGMVQAVTSFNHPTIMACGKPGWAFALFLANTTANLATCAVAVQWGLYAFAVAFVVRAYLMAVFPVLAACRFMELELGHYARQYVAPLVASGVMILAVWGATFAVESRLSMPVQVAVLAALGSAVYFISLRLIAPDRIAQAMDFVRLATKSTRGKNPK